MKTIEDLNLAQTNFETKHLDSSGADPVRTNSDRIFEVENQARTGSLVPLQKVHAFLLKDGFTLQLRQRLAGVYGMNTHELKRKFDAFDRAKELTDELGSCPNNEYEFVDALMTTWKTTMTFQKMYTLDTPYELDGKLIPKSELEGYEEHLQVFVRSADPKTMNFADMSAKIIKKSSMLGLGYTADQLDRAVGSWTRTKQNLITAEVKRSVVFNPRVVECAEGEWNSLTQAITGVNLEETKAVLKHFIWQIKRKMFGLPVDKHMMPVLNGLQEIGKSTIVKQLVHPIKDFVVMTNFKDITDGRDHELWKNFVLILDEMGNSTQSNIEEIKQKITGDTFSSRVMRSNSNTLIVNCATMIGTTNKDLSTLIFDDTGMRRFFQISCLPAFDWNVTNNIDYLMLWQSIDQNAASVLVSDKVLAGQVKEIQNVSRYQSLMECFFADRTYEANGIAEEIFADDLYREFKDYEQIHDPAGTMSSTKFGRDIANIKNRLPYLHIEKLPRKNNKVRYELAKLGEAD